MLSHASIVPLIGGETIASENVLGSKPMHLMSYSDFADNDSHIVHRYNGEVPYVVMDKGQLPEDKADIVGTVCPCAGLSQLSTNASADKAVNDWMYTTAEYILGDYKPQVFWGENAPGFATDAGLKVRNRLFDIAKKNGYTFSVYKTKSLYHGVPQVRNRSFYFFWKGSKTPIFEWYNKSYKPIEQLILDVKSNFQTETINKNIPSHDPYYRFILEEMHGGRTHKEHSALVDPTSARGNDTYSYIEMHGYTYDKVGEWMAKNGYEKEVEKCKYRFEKLNAGGSIMRRGVVIPKDRIGAFVGHYPTMLTHPVEDRFINYREAMTIMGLPDDFELLKPSRSSNHICQNVPVPTAEDMVREIAASLDNKRKWVDNDYVMLYNGPNETKFVNNNRMTLEDFF